MLVVVPNVLSVNGLWRCATRGVALCRGLKALAVGSRLEKDLKE